MSIFNLAIWDFLGRFASYGITFLTGILLTRLLTPEDFGIFGILLSVTALSSLFLDFGFRTAIVQAQTLSDQQLNTVFFLNLVISLAIVAVIVIVSPWLSAFYGVPELPKYLGVIAVTFITNSLASVPSGIIQRKLKFKHYSVVTLSAALTGGIISVSLALSGFGIWSLVASNVVNSLVVLFGCFFVSKWIPTLDIDLRSIKPLWVFGSKLFGAYILDTIFTRIDSLIIPKLFSVELLGYYNRAQSLDSLVRTFSSTSIVGVMFPIFARNQDDKKVLRDLYIRALHFITLASVGIAGLFALSAYDVIVILFTEKWAPTAGLFRIMAITAFVYPTSALMVNLIAASGDSRSFLHLEVLKKAVLLPTYLVLLLTNITSFLLALGAAYVVCLFFNTVYVGRALDVGKWSQWKAMSIYLAAGLLSSITALFVLLLLPAGSFVRLILTSGVFIATYGLLNLLLRTEGFIELRSKISTLINDKRNPNISSAA